MKANKPDEEKLIELGGLIRINYELIVHREPILLFDKDDGHLVKTAFAISEEEYHKFFTSDEFNRLFNELIVDKLAISQIMLLLREKPLSAREISEILGLSPSEVSRHINSSSKQGLVRYDVNRKCYALA